MPRNLVAPFGVAGLLVGLLTVVALAGCSGGANGTPGTKVSTSGPHSGPAPMGGRSQVSLPPRPRTLTLTGVDPCTLLTATQRASLGVDPGVPGHPDVNWHDPQCGFQLVDPGTLPSYNVQTVTSAGIQYWMTGDLVDNIRQISVAGFPAVDVSGKAATSTSCQTVVSVADGQMLIVQFDFPPIGMTATQSCRHTEQVAADAVATLQTAS